MIARDTTVETDAKWDTSHFSVIPHATISHFLSRICFLSARHYCFCFKCVITHDPTGPCKCLGRISSRISSCFQFENVFVSSFLTRTNARKAQKKKKVFCLFAVNLCLRRVNYERVEREKKQPEKMWLRITKKWKTYHENLRQQRN